MYSTFVTVTAAAMYDGTSVSNLILTTMNFRKMRGKLAHPLAQKPLGNMLDRDDEDGNEAET